MLTILLWLLLVLWLLRAVNVALFYVFIPHLPAASRRAAGAAFVSVVVPARDEEREIGAATESKLVLDDPDFEVVVVDDQSRDGTRGILRGLERRFPDRFRVVEGVEPPAGWLGKPHALHEGVATARASRPDDWLLFSDADVFFEPGLLARALSHAESKRLDFLALMPRMEMKGFGEWLLPAAVLLWGLAGLFSGPGTLLFALALAVAILTAAVRGALHVRLGYSLASILFHPLFILAMGVTGLRSTWVNGVLGRHTWRGRQTDARSLQF